jgi:predicted metal-dependent hydrolase
MRCTSRGSTVRSGLSARGASRQLAATAASLRTLLAMSAPHHLAGRTDHLAGGEIEYTVRRSARARRVRVNVHADSGVEVVLPARAPERVAAATVEELRPWIERRLEEAHAALARIAARAGTLPYLDTVLELVPQQERRRVHRDGRRLLVPVGDARPALERFYRRAARAEIAARLDRASASAGLSYTALDIRGQRTRWASCSASGRMSFNWRLLLAPERVLDYVVWHEVCHLELLDHSPRFWGLLERRWPSYREEREWLRRNGAMLVL